MFIVLLIVFVAALAALCFDALNTAKGIKAGIAEEANTIIRKFVGPRPTFKQILAVEVPQRLAVLGVGCIPGPERYPATLQVLAFITFVVYVGKNIQGGRQWKWMFAHPGQKLPQMNTVWQKIVGFWG